ncbi:MBL fold metallo-hydrolase [Candidatus Woesearchaeota archaeon]|nr:MBL fold metallo-hydrolase [Candidatus Woesearchaeota archaeon]
MKVCSVRGNDFKLDGGAMFGHAPKPTWKKWIKPDKLNRISLASRSLYVKTLDYHIVCEAGIGNFLEDNLAKRYGADNSEHKLIENLKFIGIKEDDVDYVILSHLHFDHAGGLISKGTNPFELHFPNATYIVSKEQFERASNPHIRDRTSFIRGLTDSLEKSGRLTLVDKEKISQLDGVVSFYYSQGHTPGQLHSLFHGDKEKVFFAGDLAPGIDWLNLPITMGYDRQPETLVEEKKKIFYKAVQEKWLMFYTHDPFIAASRISADKNKYEAARMVSHLNNYSLD